MTKQSWKFVSVWNCIKIIIFAIVALAIIFIPVSINGESVSTYKILPIIGDGSFFETFINDNLASSIATIIPTIGAMGTVSTIFTVSTYAFFIIIAIDVVFAILLIITRSNLLRAIFRLFSILFWFAMLFIGLAYLLYVVAIVYGAIINGTLTKLVDMGILIGLGFNVAALFICKKQSKWFKKPFPIACYKDKK